MASLIIASSLSPQAPCFSSPTDEEIVAIGEETPVHTLPRPPLKRSNAFSYGKNAQGGESLESYISRLNGQNKATIPTEGTS